MNANPCHNHVSQFEICKQIYTSGILNKVKLTPTSKLVLIALANHYPKVFPSQKFIADQLGITERSVIRAIQELKNKGLILYITKNVNNYTFTNIFFEMINLSVRPGQIDTLNTDKMSDKQIKEQRNNNKVLNFSKNEQKRPYQQTGMHYKSPEATRSEISKVYKRDDKSPMNDKETALKFILELQDKINNPIIRMQVEKVKQKWNL